MGQAFFVPHVDATYFVDYGCADGAMLEALSKVVDSELCGYDNDPHMLSLAKERNIPREIFTDDWNRANFDHHYISGYYGQKSCLILSSIIHEIYTYLDEAGVKDFWNRVFNSGFDYIVVRDMALSSFIWSPELSVAQVRERADPQQLKDFEEKWGSIDKDNNAVHFLLKYRYKDNWQREVKENYLPVNIDFIRGKNFLHESGFNYKEIMFEHFSVPFIRKQVKKDFDVNLNQPTHYKLIWEKK